jgi:hypothetical protein
MSKANFGLICKFEVLGISQIQLVLRFCARPKLAAADTAVVKFEHRYL